MSSEAAQINHAPDKAEAQDSRAHRARWTVLSVALALCLFLLVIRSYIIGFDWYSLLEPRSEVPKMFIGAFYDFVFVGGLTAAWLLLLALCRRHPRLLTWLCGLFILLALMTLLICMVNVPVVKTLGTPFNFPWLHYSGFLKSRDARQAMAAAFTLKTVAALLMACGGMLLIAFFIYAIARLIVPRFVTTKTLALLLVPLLCEYYIGAHWYLHERQWRYWKTANPITAFIESYFVSGNSVALFTMKTPIGPDDVLTVVERRETATLAPLPGATEPIRNVVLLVLESVPVQYLDIYGGRYGVTPELTKARAHSVIFSNIYAHAPATNYSMVSLLCSAYPWVSYMAVTEVHPDVQLPSLSGELKKQGYSNAFFYSSDVTFQGSDRFLSHRQFDLVEDYQTRKCNRASFSSKWSFLNGSDDACTVESLLDWTAAQKDKPWFGMLWTMQTHYPYFVAGAEQPYGQEETFNRYLNALHHADESLGQLLKTLEERGLSRSTLVVVVGDHGEAFRQHGQTSHGTRLYEENVHIPLILINPQLFHGETYSSIGGLLDVAPTIMHALGRPLPDEWQGRSMFSPNRHNRTYFFAPWSEYLFGYRDGDFKFLYNATTGAHELYDLSNDPAERNNVASQFPDRVREGEQRLAAWVQNQNKFMDAEFAKGQQGGILAQK